MIITNLQTRFLAAITLLLITLLCCPSPPERATPPAGPELTPTPPPVITAATPTPPLPTPTATPIPSLALGEWITWNDLSISIESYEVTDRCRGEGEGPAEGAKLLYVWAAMRNDGENVVQCPASLVTITYGDGLSNFAVGAVCKYDDEALGNDCCGRLYPDVECGGWELFEIPEGHRVEGTLVEALSGPKLDRLAAWRLASGQ